MAAARAAPDSVLDDAGIPHRQMPLLPFRWPRWMFRAVEILGAPLVPPIYLWSRIGSMLNP